MQWELYRHGPMAVSVYVDDNFKKYDPRGYDNSINLTDADHPERHYFYDEVNHLVLLVGWKTNVTVNDLGEEEHTTYWIIQNSWGEWGPHGDGSMEIEMGINAYGRKDGAVEYEEDMTNSNATKQEVAVIYLSILGGILLIAAIWILVAKLLAKKSVPPPTDNLAL